jgi:hypothetical protein
METANLIRNISRLTRYCASLIVADYDTETPPRWVANDWEASLIDQSSGRVLAYVCQDDNGRYYPTLYVSPWRALRIMKTQLGYVSSLASFPRVALDLFRLKASSFPEARRIIGVILTESA